MERKTNWDWDNFVCGTWASEHVLYHSQHPDHEYWMLPFTEWEMCPQRGVGRTEMWMSDFQGPLHRQASPIPGQPLAQWVRHLLRWPRSSVTLGSLPATAGAGRQLWWLKRLFSATYVGHLDWAPSFAVAQEVLPCVAEKKSRQKRLSPSRFCSLAHSAFLSLAPRINKTKAKPPLFSIKITAVTTVTHLLLVFMHKVVISINHALELLVMFYCFLKNWTHSAFKQPTVSISPCY